MDEAIGNLAMITRVSSWWLCTQLVSACVKTISSSCGAWPLKGLDLVAYTMVWGSFFALHINMSRTRRPLLTLQGPQNIILTSLLSSVRSTFPPNLRDFSLYGWALLAIGLVSTCGLETTLGIAIHCNTTIKSESVYCAVVACGGKYVCLLVTTLGFTVCCNTTIRPEFFHCVLVT